MPYFTNETAKEQGELIYKKRATPTVVETQKIIALQIIPERILTNVCKGWNHAFANIIGHHHDRHEITALTTIGNRLKCN